MKSKKEQGAFLYTLHKTYERQTLHPDVITNGFEMAASNIQRDAYNQAIKDASRNANTVLMESGDWTSDKVNKQSILKLLK